jgi:hypothetical protein
MSQDPNRDYEGAVGLGEHRPPGERWPGPPSEHAPARSFDGGLDDPSARAWLELADSIAELGRKLASQPQDGPTGVASGNTDADGMLALIVYKCAAGEQFRLRRATVEAQGFSPAAAFAAADAWLGFYDLTQDSVPEITAGLAVNDIYQGALKDFAPSVSGGPLFPALFVDGEEQAAEIRGPNTLMLLVFEGPPTTRITVNYQGDLKRPRGIA